MPSDEKLVGKHAWFSSFSSNSRGVAILIQNSVPFSFNSLYSDPNALVLVNIYAPNNDNPDLFFGCF